MSFADSLGGAKAISIESKEKKESGHLIQIDETTSDVMESNAKGVEALRVAKMTASPAVLNESKTFVVSSEGSQETAYFRTMSQSSPVS